MPEFLKPNEKSVEQHVSPIDNKVTVLREPTTLPLEENDLDFLPSRFNHEMTKPYMLQIKAQQIKNFEALMKDPNNCNRRLELAKSALLFAEMLICFLEAPDLRDGEEEAYTEKLDSFMDMSKQAVRDAKILNMFHPLNYYIESMIMEFAGIDCKNIEQAGKYVQLLKLALALDPESKEIKTTLDETVNFLRKRWTELKEETTIDDTTYRGWTAKLEQWLNSDALKELFQSNPNLFKLSSDVKYAEFFKKHPELKSIDALNTKAVYVNNNNIHNVVGRVHVYLLENFLTGVVQGKAVKAMSLSYLPINEVKDETKVTQFAAKGRFGQFTVDHGVIKKVHLHSSWVEIMKQKSFNIAHCIGEKYILVDEVEVEQLKDAEYANIVERHLEVAGKI